MRPPYVYVYLCPPAYYSNPKSIIKSLVCLNYGISAIYTVYSRTV
ncbi:hypothetical protein OSCI_580003 [Kamptonema sp. PCC 6506]|nr:hypothetical protein OSCI_580003 [Kamptonema sp. PCC 6506]